MNSNEGRLQTGEHILARVLQNRFPGIKVRISKFFLDYGEVEFLFDWNLRELNLDDLNRELNEIISLELVVKKEVFNRDEIGKLDLGRVPEDISQVRVVSIGDFDSRPCKDPHVDNTNQIGKFIVEKIKRVGQDRYRFRFRVE